MQLATLQQQFLRHLDDQPSTVAREIVVGGKISVERRLGIYHHAYRARLTEVLQDVFERVWAYIGDANFERCAHEFIAAYPPSAPTLQRFGESFPTWLASRYLDDGDIADVATIDWQLRCAFDSADATPIGIAALQTLSADDWGHVGFVFHPALQIVPMTFNAAAIWAALDSEASPPDAVRLLVPMWLMVWRRAEQPHFISIAAPEATLLTAMQRGQCFAAACEVVAAQFPDDAIATLAGTALRRWVDDEVIVGMVL